MSESLLRDGLTWWDFADSRPHRLKRGRHFDGDVRTLLKEALATAEAHGRGLLAVIDELGHENHYLWVQFADQQIDEGEPCRCGGTSFARLHQLMARCDACGATAALTPRAGTQNPWRRGRRLSDYVDVELLARDHETDDDIERWYGRGTDPFGYDVVIEVDYVLRQGRRIPDPLEEGESVHRVRRWPIAYITRAAELGALADWPAGDDLLDVLQRRAR